LFLGWLTMASGQTEVNYLDKTTRRLRILAGHRTINIY